MYSFRHNNRGRDVPDTGLQRTSYKFMSDEVEPEIRCETAGKLRGSVISHRVNNDVATDHNGTSDVGDSTALNMEKAGDDPLDVSDATLLPRDQYDLADLTRQNNGSCQSSVKTWPPVYTRLDLAFSITSLVMFAVDLGTDVALVVKYHVTDQYLLRNLTLGFILVPSLASGCGSVVWSYIDYRNHVRHNRSKWPMVVRCLFTFFQLGRVYRMVEFIYHITRTWKEQDPEKVKDISLKAIEQKRDAAILGLVDGFLESTLQLLLQLYLTVRAYVPLDELRVLALLTSWFSTALTVTSYYRTVRRAMNDRYNVRYGPSALYMAYRLFELGPRLLLLGLCVAYFLNILLGAVALHVIVMFLMHLYINPRLTGVCNGQICRTVFLLLISFISVFCFINLKDRKTLWIMVFYYAVFYVENFAIMGVLVGLTQAGIIFYSPWYFTAYSVIPGFVLHMLCLSLYYKFCHPQKTRCKNQSPLYKTSTELIQKNATPFRQGSLGNLSSPHEKEEEDPLYRESHNEELIHQLLQSKEASALYISRSNSVDQELRTDDPSTDKNQPCDFSPCNTQDNSSSSVLQRNHVSGKENGLSEQRL
ncbi:XK-related protein 6 [Mizuhopecten yessoensis]|uniref:XK-related protein n=2 Tax=Mizuhopecten yessoensis TaxID=6573 RepID=A0A210Q9E9_MIZYE|nr:XK-related protein 6 [Mizuhopecten yessoensis]